MKLVVVGGQGRKVGKTSVIAGLIRGLKTLAWTAVKISHHGGDTDWQDTPSADDLPVSAMNCEVGPGLGSTLVRDGEPLGATRRGAPTPTIDPEHHDLPAPGGATRRVAPTPAIDLGHDGLPAHLDFLLSEEKDPKALRDTSRFLAAGARRALWMRVREGKLSEALPELLEALQGDEHVIIESNSILAFLQPTVFLLVIGESGREVKASARQLLGRADAFVAVRPDLNPLIWPAISLQMLEGKPVFPVSPGEWSNPALCQFVRERLAPIGKSV
jgi:hypothetical protein